MDLPETSEQEVQNKQCRRCGEVLPLTKEHWYFSGGRPSPPCRKCQSLTSKARRAAKRTPSPAPTSDPASNLPVPSPSKALRRAGENDAAEVFRVGAALLKRHSATLIARLVKYANDPKSPHHWDALKMLTERGLPVKSYGTIGAVEAAGKNPARAQPTVNINILPATQAEIAPAIDVRVVPEFPEEE